MEGDIDIEVFEVVFLGSTKFDRVEFGEGFGIFGSQGALD